MATLSDLALKRDELNAAIAAYTQAVQDLAAGTATQQDADNAKATAQARGDELAKLIAQVKQDDPAVTSDDDLFSNPSQQNLTRRNDVGKIMRTGKLDIVHYLDFNNGTIDPALLTLSVNASYTEYEFVDGGSGKFLRLKAFGGTNSSARISLETVEDYPVGTKFEVRVRQSSVNQAAHFMWLRTQRYGAAPYVSAFSGKYVSPPMRIGGGSDENGNDLAVAYSANESIAGEFKTFELIRVDQDTIEWYRDGVLLGTTSGRFALRYRFAMELFRHIDSNGTETLDIDWIRITQPPA